MLVSSLVCLLFGGYNALSGSIHTDAATNLVEIVKTQYETTLSCYDNCNQKATDAMERLGETKEEILVNFELFSDIIEKIQGRPDFKQYTKGDIHLPEFDVVELRDFSSRYANMLSALGGIGAGAAIFAATGGSAGMLLGSAISSINLVGAIALAGGIIKNIQGSAALKDAKELHTQMRSVTDNINLICEFLNKLKAVSLKYNYSLIKINKIYQAHIKALNSFIDEKYNDWSDLTDKEKLITANSVLLTRLLLSMYKVELVLKTDNETQLNIVNQGEIESEIGKANVVLRENRLTAAI